MATKHNADDTKGVGFPIEGRWAKRGKKQVKKKKIARKGRIVAIDEANQKALVQWDGSKKKNWVPFDKLKKLNDKQDEGD